MKNVALLIFALLTVAGGASAQTLREMDEDVRRFGLSWLDPIADCPLSLIDRPSKDITADYESCEQHLSKCVEGCRSGDEERCFSAAATHELLENGARASALYTRACTLGVDSACTNLAARLRYREQGDETCISTTFVEMCKRDEVWGCAMSGVALWQAEGLERDASQAGLYAKKACEIDPDSDACDLASDILAEIEESEGTNE